ncbi:MAG: sulfite exporter TauE/SafE family protein [Desulfomonile tiedjei]|nr:sulfite exporter TauE/SafE family protein [Desulfomonile tiedjei]
MITILLIYTAVGAIAGILAGLLGIGGGIVVVPMLLYCFTGQGVSHEVIMHLALGTSMASIMFTAISSFIAHHRHGAVHWDIVRQIVLGILIGTFLGSCIAARLSTGFLSGFFVVFLYYVAIQLILNRTPRPSRHLPGKLGMFGAGNIIGAVSSFVGIGGGALSVPFMVWCNIPMHHAIGTSAAIGFPIAVAGTIGYVYTGLFTADLPRYSVGYVYLPGLAGIVCASVLTAPLGVRFAHTLPVKRLKQVFAVLLAIMGTRMLLGLL